MSPWNSKLYAIEKLRADVLDIEIDADIINNLANKLHIQDDVVELGLMSYQHRNNYNYDEYVIVYISSHNHNWVGMMSGLKKH